MPIIKSAIKRMKQTAVRRDRNVALKRDIKTATKAFMAEPSAKALSVVQSEIDTAVKKNVLNKKTAARRKAQFAAVAKGAGVKLSAKKATKAPVAAAKKPAATKTTAVAAKKPAVKAATTTAAKKPVANATATDKKPTAAKKPAAKKAPAKKA